MLKKTKHGVRDDAAWYPAYLLSEAGWTAEQVAAVMGGGKAQAGRRITRIDRMSPAERDALVATCIDRIVKTADAYALLGKMDEARAELARLELMVKAHNRMEELVKPEHGPDAPRPPENKREQTVREEGEYRDVSTEELRARLRHDLETQAARFGFSGELERAFARGASRQTG